MISSDREGTRPRHVRPHVWRIGLSAMRPIPFGCTTPIAMTTLPAAQQDRYTNITRQLLGWDGSGSDPELYSRLRRSRIAISRRPHGGARVTKFGAR